MYDFFLISREFGENYQTRNRGRSYLPPGVKLERYGNNVQYMYCICILCILYIISTKFYIQEVHGLSYSQPEATSTAIPSAQPTTTTALPPTTTATTAPASSSSSSSADQQQPTPDHIASAVVATVAEMGRRRLPSLPTADGSQPAATAAFQYFAASTAANMPFVYRYAALGCALKTKISPKNFKKSKQSSSRESRLVVKYRAQKISDF